MAMMTEKIGRAEIRWLGLPLPAFTASQRVAVEQAAGDLLFWWREEMAPEHFKSSAYAKYGGREERVFEHRRDFKKRGERAPMVSPRATSRDYRGAGTHWAGQLRREFLRGTMRIDVTGRRTGNLKIRAVWSNLPRQAYQDVFGKNSTPGPKMFKELTIVTEAETEVMARKFVEFFDARLAAMQGETEAAKAA